MQSLQLIQDEQSSFKAEEFDADLGRFTSMFRISDHFGQLFAST